MITCTQKASTISQPNTLRQELVYLSAWTLCVAAASPSGEALASEEGQQIAFIIPHTHWEGAVFKTREEYLQEGLPHIVTALSLLERYPDYRFTLDQVCYVRPFLERYPTEVPAFRKFLAQGRLQIVGGTDTMNDNNIPSGESIVRQYLLGKSYFHDTLGYDVTTGWGLDAFGQNAQMPQILKLAGMTSYWFQRGPAADGTPSEFLWKGIDGTQIPAFWLPLSYILAYRLPGNEPEFSRALRHNFDLLTPYSQGPERALLAGADVTEPEESLPPMIEQFNSSGHAPFQAQFAVPAEFEAPVAKRANRPVIQGELNPVLQGVYSTHIELKQLMRNMESQLLTAEKLGVLTSLLGGAVNSETLAQAWEPLLFNQRHDISTMVDKVYEDSLQDYEYARRLADGEIRREFALLDSHIDTSGAGVPVVVFNSLGWRRTDIVEMDIPFSDSGVHDFALMDAQGTVVPVQFLKIQRGADGGIRQARIAFIARDIPSLGYVVYHALPKANGSPTPASDNLLLAAPDTLTHEFRGAIENEFYRLSLNMRTGEITSLLVKDGHWEALAGPGNVVARENDRGDAWELNGPIGYGLAASTLPIGTPRAAQTQWSNEFEGPGEKIEGPVFSEFHVKHALGKNNFATRIRIYQGLQRIDIRTDLVNQEMFVRYRAVFPSTIANGTLMEEIPFGAIQRPQNQEYPAQNWIDYADAHKGITLINHGLPGNNVADGKLMVSLMRSASIANADDSDPSDSSLGLGKSYTVDYALIPHKGGWRAATPWRIGMEFNNPLMVHPVASHGGDLPSRWGLLEVSSDKVVVSALKVGKDGAVILRVYEASGRPVSEVHVSLHTKLEEVHEANLLEDPGTHIDSRPDGFTFGLKPYEIKTFRLQVTRLSSASATP